MRVRSKPVAATTLITREINRFGQSRFRSVVYALRELIAIYSYRVHHNPPDRKSAAGPDLTAAQHQIDWYRKLNLPQDVRSRN